MKKMLFKSEDLLVKEEFLNPGGSILVMITKEHPDLVIATVLPDRVERCFSTNLL